MKNIKKYREILDRHDLRMEKDGNEYEITKNGNIFPFYRIYVEERQTEPSTFKYVLRDIRNKKSHEHLYTMENCIQLIDDFESIEIEDFPIEDEEIEEFPIEEKKIIKRYDEFNNEKKIIISEFEQINEKRSSFSISVGRARYGFQESVYDLGDQCGVDVDVKKLGGFLEVYYRITVNGDTDKVNRFLTYIRHLE